MRALLFTLPFLVLQAQDPDLSSQLAKVQRLSTDQVLTLQARLAADPAPAERKAYYSHLIAYTLASRGGKDARPLVERSLKALEGTTDPELMALQASFFGLMIGFSGESAMTLAPRAQALFERAQALRPGSPRVLVARGVHVLHTPVFFGGGPAAAMGLLEGAVKAAEQEAAPADPWAPAWGRVESLSWLAYAQAQSGQKVEARATVDRALALDPGNGFIQHRVLPMLQEKK